MLKLKFRKFCFICALAFSIVSPFNAFAKEKVILDADMVDAFDDGIAMLMLATSPKVDLLGVTTVAGNSWAEAGTASALYQLEIAGKSDIPVYMGAQFPFRAGRHENMDSERKLNGVGHDVWLGSFGIPQPKSWQEFYKINYGKAVSEPQSQNAVDFIIDTVRKYPNEVTIAAIGPCTNLAMAIRKAPDIIPRVKRVIYMGGAFFQNGNVTPAAEFNWWFDPESTRMAVRAPFKEQIVVGLDVAEDIEFEKPQYDRFIKTLDNNALGKLLERSHVGASFKANPEFSHFVWDVIVSAIIINPEIIKEEVTQFIDINDQFGLSYGQSLAFPKTGPVGSQQARIILEIDEDGFWNMVNDMAYWKTIVK